MLFYTAHFMLFFFSALLSVLAIRISSEYLKMYLPGFFFGLIFGSIHLATVGRVFLFAILSGAAYFAAVYLASRTVRFKKTSKEPSPHRKQDIPQQQNRDRDTPRPQSGRPSPSETTTMIFDIRSTAQLFENVIAKIVAESASELAFKSMSLVLAGAISGFAGSISLAGALRLVAGNVLGPWDYCRITFVGTLAGIVFLLISMSDLWGGARPPESFRAGLGYFIWQGSVGIAMVTALGSVPHNLLGLLPTLYFSEVVPFWQKSRLAWADKWYEFLFGTSALQNYVSELFGILIAIVLVDRVIKYRTERRARPRRDMACVLTFELMDAFIAKYLPAPYKCNGAGGRRFGNYRASSGVYKFHEEALSWSAVTSQILSAERLRWERINWPDSTGLTEEVRRAEEETLKSALGDIRQYGKDIGDFLLQHQAVLDEEILRKLDELRFTIATGFAGYYEPLKITYADAFGVDIKTLLPKVLRQTVELNLYLERIYRHEHHGGICE
jgi:hypothetical protein